MDNSKYREYLKTEKWKKIAMRRMAIDGYQCQMCGCSGTANNSLEIHHLSYRNLYNEENRIFEDLITLCHVCHKSVHRMMNRQTSASGRRGWSDNKAIPTVHAYNITGTNKDFVERAAGGEQ